MKISASILGLIGITYFLLLKKPFVSRVSFMTILFIFFLIETIVDKRIKNNKKWIGYLKGVIVASLFISLSFIVDFHRALDDINVFIVIGGLLGVSVYFLINIRGKEESKKCDKECGKGRP